MKRQYTTSKNKFSLLNKLILNRNTLDIIDSFNLKMDNFTSRNKTESKNILLNDNVFSQTSYRDSNNTNRINNLKFFSITETNKKKLKTLPNRRINLKISNRYPKEKCLRYFGKFQKIFNNISSRVKKSLNKKESSFTRRSSVRNYSIKVREKNPIKIRTPITKTKTLRMNLNAALNSDNFINVMKNEFNCKELMKMEMENLKKKLYKLRPVIKSHVQIYNNYQRLNEHLIREFKLDKDTIINSCKKKYETYKESVEIIEQLRNKKLNIVSSDGKKYDIFSDSEVKSALDEYYKFKSDSLFLKSLEFQKELINLNRKNKVNKISHSRQQYENDMKMSKLKEIVQKKLLHKEIYLTDFDKRKKEFFDEDFKIMHKCTKWKKPSKHIKSIFRQETINKVKSNIGLFFGSV